MEQNVNKQLLDEVGHDIMNYLNRGHRHEVLAIHDIMRKPNSIIVLLYIFHIIHPQKQKRSVQPFCFWGEHSKGLSNQADVELGMIDAISAADIAFIMSSSQAFSSYYSSYCELIECSRPIKFFVVSLMYNNTKLFLFLRTTNVSRWRSNHLVGRRSKLRFKWSDHLSQTQVCKPEFTRRNNECSSFLAKKLIWLFTKYAIMHCLIRYFG